MSRFSQALTQALADYSWNAARYGEQGGLHKSRVSRWLSGAIAPEPESLRDALAPFRVETRAELLASYVRDITENVAPGIVHVAPESGPVLRKQAPAYGKPQRPDGISDELWGQICRVAELARDTPEIAAIFAEFDRLIQRQINANFRDNIGNIVYKRL